MKELKPYIITIVVGVIGFAVGTFFGNAPTREIERTEVKKEEKIAVNVETKVDKNTESSTKKITKAQKKTVIKNPKFNDKGQVISGSKVTIFDEPTKRIDKTKTVVNNTETKANAEKVTKEESKTEKIIERSKSRYSLGASMPVAKINKFKPTLEPLRLEKATVEVGVRVLDSPVWATSAYSFENKSVSLGFRLEF